MDAPDREQLDALWDACGLAPADRDGGVEIAGDTATVGSPHQIARAGALAYANLGGAMAALWRERTGRGQEVTVDADAVTFAMNPYLFLRRNGHIAHPLFTIQEPCSGFFETADGRWVYVAAAAPGLRNKVLAFLNCPNDKAACQAAMGQVTAAAFEAAAHARGITGAVVQTPEEWAKTDQAKHLAELPLIEIERIGDAPPQPLGPADRPLRGVRVADMTHVFAGPMLSRHLAEQGADVLHLSSIHPDLVDAVGFAIETGIGKRSAIVDFDLPEDHDRLAALLSEADVFVQSWAPGVVAGKGFGPQKAAELKPGVIYVSITCFGASGPWRNRKGFDGVALASTGMLAMQAQFGRLQVPPPGIVTDGLLAILGASAVTATLLRRAREGGSWHIRLSLARIAMWLHSLGVAEPKPAQTGQPRLTTMDTPFGEIEFVAPVLGYSETPGRFEQPPVPIGASPAAWLPR